MSTTNEAFTPTTSGRRQLFAQNALRAAENGVPVVRAATTGISAIIGPDGAVAAAVEDAAGRREDVAGFAIASLPLGLPPTPYRRYGDWLVALCIGVVAWGMRAAWATRGSRAGGARDPASRPRSREAGAGPPLPGARRPRRVRSGTLRLQPGPLARRTRPWLHHALRSRPPRGRPAQATREGRGAPGGRPDPHRQRPGVRKLSRVPEPARLDARRVEPLHDPARRRRGRRRRAGASARLGHRAPAPPPDPRARPDLPRSRRPGLRHEAVHPGELGVPLHDGHAGPAAPLHALSVPLRASLARRDVPGLGVPVRRGDGAPRRGLSRGPYGARTPPCRAARSLRGRDRSGHLLDLAQRLARRRQSHPRGPARRARSSSWLPRS